MFNVHRLQIALSPFTPSSLPPSMQPGPSFGGRASVYDCIDRRVSLVRAAPVSVFYLIDIING
jgi:hypothetical protein